MAEQGDTQERWGTGSHPLLDAAAGLHRALDVAHGAVAAGSDPAWLSAADQGRLLVDLGRAQHRLSALLMQTLAAAGGPDGVTSTDASRSPADWLAHRLHVRPARLAGDARLGAAVAEHPQLAAALAAGSVSVDHAREVTDTLTDLPVDDLDPKIVVEAERVLVGYCEDFTPPEVRRLGRHLLETLAPDVAEALEAKRLADEERHARKKTTLRLRRTGHGTRRITGEIPELHAGILDAALRAITNPRRDHLTGETDSDTDTDTNTDGQDVDPFAPTVVDGQRVTAAQRLGQAFCVLIENLATDRLPTHGRSPVTVVVTLDEDKLRDDLAGVGLLDTGETITLGEARRLACQHGIRPVVLGGTSEVLDLGRTRRCFTHAQRVALALTHPECQARGCTVPAAWCEAHHRTTPWAAGGTTDLTNGALLCAHHHHTAHDPTYDTTWHPDGTVTYHRRC